MNSAGLLGGACLARLHRRLQVGLARAPANGLLSITLDLGAGDADWLAVDPARDYVSWWAPPAAGQAGDRRLALGRAVAFSTAGGGRFAALQAAFCGLQTRWQHDDEQNSGVEPAAHIGFAFDEEDEDAAATTAALPNARLLVPAILLRHHAGRRTATFSCPVGAGERAMAHWLAELQSVYRGNGAQPLAPVWRRQPSPLVDRAFLARARAALAEIARGKLAKLVLTRRVRFAGEQPAAIAPMLAALAHRQPRCTLYAVGQAGQSFVGATPERLVKLQAGTVYADALAGTAWLSASDSRPASRGLLDDKNRREHQLVVDAIRAALDPLCTSLVVPPAATVLHLSELQHLQTRVVGRLRPGAALFDLLAGLHPTPAVGGAPGAAARQWLRHHGERRVAWYTGGIGWVERNGDGEVVVALRCARLRGGEAELFAGAGIVAGSEPEQELAETEVKLAVMADALQQSGGVDGCRSSRNGTR
ncbi:isochorismate synthase [Accumulibacter sp.]|uniref:isochorismate synthase n=1 Tax=Accumulibacter sp. TaxID=2053492 RepID=UPI00261A4191|nr:isochorismate synthase [Accumulibacter sp.]